MRVELQTELHVAMTLAGFVIEDTGGGCQSYGMRLRDGTGVWITDEGGGHAPSSVCDRVWLSRMNEKGEILYEQREQTVVHALVIIGAWEGIIQVNQKEEK